MRVFVRYPGGKDRAVTLSYDDGVQQDVRLIELMKKYGVKGTFNLNSARFIKRDHQYPEGTVWRAMVDEDVLKTYDPAICDIACHTAHHPMLLNMTEAEIAEEILSDRRALESLFGHIITGMAIPYGPYDETTVRVAELCGITYMRTITSSFGYQLPKRFMPFHPTCHHNHKELPAITERFLTEPVKEDGFLLYVWGHSFEFERYANWEVIERFFEQVSGRENVWYATNDEIFGYVSKFRLLEYSADGKIISNPTDTEIWFSADDKTYRVAPGCAVTL